MGLGLGLGLGLGVGRLVHRPQVDERLARHRDEDGRVEERAERALRVHLVHGRRVGEGDGGDHEQPARGDHLALRGARALERERREHVPAHGVGVRSGLGLGLGLGLG